MDEESVFTYDQFVAHCMERGFEVKPADFGGFKVSIYARDVGTKERFFGGGDGLIAFLASLYGVTEIVEDDE